MKKIAVFYGADHKAGTTMTALCTAQILARKNRDRKVLFAAINPDKSGEYLRNSVATLDEFRLQAENRILVAGEFLGKTRYKDNLYVLGGLSSRRDERHYFPGFVNCLIQQIGESFHHIIIDAGSRLESGLTVGCLELDAGKIAVFSQGQLCCDRFLENRPVLERLGVRFDMAVLNRYQARIPITPVEIGGLVGLHRQQVAVLPNSDLGLQAELQRESLVVLDRGYRRQAEAMVRLVCSEEKQERERVNRGKRDRKWKSFIWTST